MRALLDRYGMWVHRCVLLNARLAASVPFKLLSTKAGMEQKVFGRKPKPLSRVFKSYLAGKHRLKPGSFVRKSGHIDLENATEIETHPLLDLLHNANPWTDGYQFRVGIYSDRQLFGRAFIHLVGPEQPDELWRMEPHLTKIIPHPVDFVQAYEFGEGGSKAVFSPDEVIWFRVFDPGNPWGGIGPLEAWLKTVDASFAIQAFQHWMFERGGSPDWAVVGETMPTDPQKRAFLADWVAKFGKMFNRKQSVTFVAGKPAPSLVQLSHSPRELEYGNSENAKRDQIAAAFGVPKSKVTTDDVNRANAEETDEIHLREVWADIQEVEDCLNQQLVSRYGDGLLLVHESPVVEDQTIRIQERKSQLESGYSINQILTTDGMDPVGPDGDVPMVGAGLKTLDQVINPPEPVGPDGMPLDLGGEEAEEEPAEEEKPEEREPEESTKELVTVIVRDALAPIAAQLADRPDIAAMINKALEPMRDSLAPIMAGLADRPDVAALIRKELEPMLKRVEAMEPQLADRPDVAALMRKELEPLMKRLEDLEPRAPDPSVVVKELTDQMRAAMEPVLVRVEALPPPLEVKAEATVLSLSTLWDQHYAGSLNGEVLCCKRLEPAKDKKAPALLISRVRRHFRDQFSAVAKAVEELGLAEGGRVVSDPKWQEELSNLLKPSMELFIERGGKGAMGRLPKAIDFDVQNPAVQEFVDRYTVRLATQVAGSTEVLLNTLIDEKLKQGATIKDLADGIRQLDQAVSPYRAEMIARTESARAYVAGETETWRQSGQVIAKEWLLAPDACEFCSAVAKEWAGRSVGLDDAFYKVGHVLTGTDGGRMKLDYETVGGPPLHPHCLLPGAVVAACDPVAALTAWYEGVAVEITTARGCRLAVTPNHQVLTGRGFVAANALRKGDYVISGRGLERMLTIDPHNDDLVTTSTDLAATLRETRRCSTAYVPCAPEHLHGDGHGVDGEIDVVTTDRFKMGHREAAFGDPHSKLPLGLRGDMRSLDSGRDPATVLLRLSAAAHGLMSSPDEARTLASLGVTHAHVHGLAAVAAEDARGYEAALQCYAITPGLIREFLDRGAGLVAPDEIVEVRDFHYAGHVYDLQTMSGLYVADGIVTSNCRCDLLPVLSDE